MESAVDAAGLVPLVVLGGSLTAFLLAIAAVGRCRAAGEPIVPLREHPPVCWEGGDVALVLVGYLLAASLMARQAGPDSSLVARLVDNVVLTLGASLGATAWLAARGATWSEMGFDFGSWREDLRTAVGGLALVVFPLLAIAGVLNVLVRYRHPVVDLLAGQRDGLAVAAVVISAIVAAPVAEELFFRKVLQGWLEKRLAGDQLAPVLVSALAFAAAHADQGLAYVPLFPLGLVLGTIAQRTGSIVPCILLHGLFNAVSVALLLARPGRPAAG
ncbi:MAG: lysostaphin resistance A-like protein [Pirellulales bacterium]